MNPLFRARGLYKTFFVDALRNVNLTLAPGTIVGLIGPNGSGKSTLLHCMTGLMLPSDGECETLGVATANLTNRELAQIGLVQQHPRFIDWMRVDQQLNYIAALYPRWDHNLQHRLIDVLELEEEQSRRIGELSPGTVQKVALVAAVCHRPRLLLLDEPVSALDPIARETVFRIIVDDVFHDDASIVISSHALRDIERLVDHVVCMHKATIRVDEALDTVQEQYARWWVTSTHALPEDFEEPFIVDQRVLGPQARLVVRATEAERTRFETQHQAHVRATPVDLSEIYPLLLREPAP